MDQRTLVVSCVEYYSDLKNIPSNKVFISFQQSGFIDLILDSHKTFPEMDIDFFVGMIDGLTYLESDAGEQEKEYTHHENRAAVGAEVVALLQKKHKMNDLEACEMYYNLNNDNSRGYNENKTNTDVFYDNFTLFDLAASICHG